MSTDGDLFEQIDTHSHVPVYMQIENEVRFAIASGKLKAEDQLPIVRVLGARLGVNFNTVAKAYQDLVTMGLVWSRRGMGYFVKSDVQAQCIEECRRYLIAKLHEVNSEATASGMTKKDIIEVIDKSMATDSSPYGETPPAVLALAKKKRSR